MPKIRRILLAAVGLAGALGMAGPAQAFYIVSWSNGGISYVCDDGTVFGNWGDTSGYYWISSWNWGQPPC